MTGSEFEWTEDMGEISGFGGTYEQACRAMVKAAVLWLRQHPHFKPDHRTFRGIYGVVASEDLSAKALDQAMLDAVAEKLGDSPTGAMHQASLEHAYFIHRNGWARYVEELRAREAGGRSG